MAFYLEWVRRFCLALPHTTEKVRWEHNLLFCIADKMYCVANLEPGMGRTRLIFKCAPEVFTELVELEGMIPAPYLARNHWVAVTDLGPFRQAEIKDHIRKLLRVGAGKTFQKDSRAAEDEGRKPAVDPYTEAGCKTEEVTFSTASRAERMQSGTPTP
jgi:predicted DNA-binding protein (MmcQ/YjbR family)